MIMDIVIGVVLGLVGLFGFVVISIIKDPDFFR